MSLTGAATKRLQRGLSVQTVSLSVLQACGHHGSRCKIKKVYSYSILTINAAEHALIRDFYKPTDEKRMVVLLPENGHAAWLLAEAADS